MKNQSMASPVFLGLKCRNDVISQSVRFGRFVKWIFETDFFACSYAKGPSYTAFCLQRYQFNSLRRNGPSTTFLQQTPTSLVNSKFCQGPPTQRRLSSLRPNSGASVCNHGRPSENQQDRNPAIQRGVSLSDRYSQISRSVHPAAIPQAASSQGHPSIGSPTRSTPSQIVWPPQTAILSDFRFGFRHPDRLRQDPMGPCRLQSQETWPTILSSPALLRSPPPGILAWVVASRRCCRQYRSRPLPESLLGQSPQIHCPIPYPDSSRFGILWQEGHRVPRCDRLWLCNCGQRILHDQSSIQTMSFQKASGRMGSRGVPIQAPQMATTPSLCRCATPHSSRSRRGPTTHSLQRPQVCLPCLGHQLKDPSMESLAVLCQKSHHRKEHSRTPLRLSLGQDSYRRLGGQRSLLSNLAFCLQPCPLVQETLSAQRIPLYDARYHPNRFPGAASEIDQRWKSKRTDLTSRLPLPDAVRSGFKKNRQTQSPTKFINLQIDDSHEFSIYGVFRIQNNIFTHY